MCLTVLSGLPGVVKQCANKSLSCWDRISIIIYYILGRPNIVPDTASSIVPDTERMLLKYLLNKHKCSSSTWAFLQWFYIKELSAVL